MLLHDSLTAALQPLSTSSPLSIYNCGYTPREPLHLGNARSIVVFDALREWLERVSGQPVHLLQSLGDADQRVDEKAAAAGIARSELVDRLEERYRTDLGGLGVHVPADLPRSSDEVGHAIRVIEGLLLAGRAVVDGDQVVLRGDSDASPFSRFDADGSIRDAMCFAGRSWTPQRIVLWEPADDPRRGGWASPWGRGLPSPNIICVLFIKHFFGGHVDIHTGASDLYTHNEIELLIGQAAAPAGLASTWLHSGLVEESGKRMSISHGNVRSVQDATARWGGPALRMWYLGHHYRDDLDAGTDVLAASRMRWDEIRNGYRNAIRTASDDGDALPQLREEVAANLHDDFHTDFAVHTIETAMLSSTSKSPAGLESLRETASWLGFDVSA